MMFPQIKSLLEAEVPGAVVGEDFQSTPKALLIDKEHIHQTCKFLYSNEQTYFDQLACLTGLDNGTEAETMEVIYNLYSIPYNFQLMIKVILDRSEPEINTVSDIWRTANWHEREAFDLLGIKFLNHPDLRRILLPNDWIGHPLRKDYREQEEYHGMAVMYDRKSAPSDLKDLNKT